MGVIWEWECGGHTVSSCDSPIFFPASLLIQSSPPDEDPSLDMRPGTTRGMVYVVRGVIADNLLESVGRMVVAGFVLCRVSGQK